MGRLYRLYFPCHLSTHSSVHFSVQEMRVHSVEDMVTHVSLPS